MDADLIDIGGDLNFKANNGDINTITGPMEEKQLREFFSFANEPPKVAIYFQIDYFFTPEIASSMSSKQMMKLIQEYVNGNWTRFRRFSESINN